MTRSYPANHLLNEEIQKELNPREIVKWSGNPNPRA